MRKRIPLLLCTLALLVLSASFLYSEIPQPFHVSVTTEAGTERINVWENDAGACFVFLPAYAEPADARIEPDTGTEVSVDGRILSDGMDCGAFESGVPYRMEYRFFGRKQLRDITFLRSGALPALCIDTESGSMKRVNGGKENKESGSYRLYSEAGEIVGSGALSIKGRGNATWEDFEKKPYNITLEAESDLLGMGAAQNWALLANAADASHLRNKIVYDFAGNIGLPYSPDSKWVDLYLNGEYAGLYLLSERNEVHPERVALNGEGSVLLSLEWEEKLVEQGMDYIRTRRGEALRVRYPENAGDSTMNTIAQRFQSVENAIFAEDGIDKATGATLQSLIEEESWVLSYLVDEVFGNLDAFNASRFFYINGAGGTRVSAGPVWDYDKALGNDVDPGWSVTNPETLIVNRYDGSYKITMPWAEKLYKNPWFYDELQKAFAEVMLPAVTELLESGIDRYASVIREAAYMDACRWGYAAKRPFDGETAAVSRYIREHMAFLERVWLEGEEHCQVRVIRRSGEMFYSVPRGESLEAALNRTGTGEAEYSKWLYSDTREPFDIHRPITEDTELVAAEGDDPGQQIDRLIKLIPLGVIALMGFAVLAADLRRMWQDRERR